MKSAYPLCHVRMQSGQSVINRAAEIADMPYGKNKNSPMAVLIAEMSASAIIANQALARIQQESKNV